MLAYRVENKAFFVYGFAKNARANISAGELKALKHLAKELLDYSDKALTEAIKHGALMSRSHAPAWECIPDSRFPRRSMETRERYSGEGMWARNPGTTSV